MINWSAYAIRLTGRRVLKTTPVFDTYWRFASERQEVFMRRVLGKRPPWTADPILGGHRFTNVYRASDRVSQYLIRHVIYDGSRRLEGSPGKKHQATLRQAINRLDD